MTLNLTLGLLVLWGKKPKSRKINVTIAHLNVCSMASHKKFYLVEQMIVHDNYDPFDISES